MGTSEETERSDRKKKYQQRYPLSKGGSESSVLGDSITLKKVEDNDLYLLEFGYEISYVENLLLREVDVGCKRDSKSNNKFLFTNQLKKIGRRGGNVRSS